MKETKFDTVFDSQKVFRILLDAYAHPGKVVRVPDMEINPPNNSSKAASIILLTLLDHEAGFTVYSCDTKEKEEVEEYLILNTGGRVKSLESADFIMVFGGFPQIENVKRGRLAYPEEGATVIYVVEKIGESLFEPGSASLTLSGPGIKERKSLSLNGLKKQELIRIAEVNKEFPLGIDVVFTDRGGKFSVLPRSTKIVEVKEI